MLATGTSLTVAAAIALAPPPAAPAGSTVTRAEPVALTGAWQELSDNLNEDLANLSAAITNYPPLPILSQLSSNLTTYAYWMTGSHGGSPTLVAQTISQHAVAVATTVATFAILAPLSFIGPFIAPGVMVVQLIADTASYPSTPETVLQAFIDAPAVYLNTTFNCCSTPLFNAAFGLLNPGPLGYLLAFAPAIATAMQIDTPSAPAVSAAPAADGPAPQAAAKQSAPARTVAHSRRSQLVATPQKTLAPRAAARPGTARKAADASARETTPADGTGHSARDAKPASRGTL
ncbi:hypothetical protein ORI20_23150 [Mycobacterium sp. CVI_P3]|uniref:PPE family protein n=1 Tax=Mycobacterium pinniadriaticum TaxID=2994102 RepID=A0ABT3SJ35_9MYCO|nr:hypothetical protein [Mycobacterium pinniadriaticum]MCX2933172.1 hypothetical protein [Mycobacterium pinniadriaticum]MCX2939528.1 hypothetical protein [Mycobacterium pinniadriaticum]